MKRTDPSPAARNVRIGSQYRPKSYEHRSPTHYEGYMLPSTPAEERVQSALLGEPKTPFASRLRKALATIFGR